MVGLNSEGCTHWSSYPTSLTLIHSHFSSPYSSQLLTGCIDWLSHTLYLHLGEASRTLLISVERKVMGRFLRQPYNMICSIKEDTRCKWVHQPASLFVIDASCRQHQTASPDSEVRDRLWVALARQIIDLLFSKHGLQFIDNVGALAILHTVTICHKLKLGPCCSLNYCQ